VDRRPNNVEVKPRFKISAAQGGTCTLRKLSSNVVSVSV